MIVVVCVGVLFIVLGGAKGKGFIFPRFPVIGARFAKKKPQKRCQGVLMRDAAGSQEKFVGGGCGWKVFFVLEGFDREDTFWGAAFLHIGFPQALNLAPVLLQGLYIRCIIT